MTTPTDAAWAARWHAEHERVNRQLHEETARVRSLVRPEVWQDVLKLVGLYQHLASLQQARERETMIRHLPAGWGPLIRLLENHAVDAYRDGWESCCEEGCVS
jgi:hypothetical protein